MKMPCRRLASSLDGLQRPLHWKDFNGWTETSRDIAADGIRLADRSPSERCVRLPTASNTYLTNSNEWNWRTVTVVMTCDDVTRTGNEAYLVSASVCKLTLIWLGFRLIRSDCMPCSCSNAEKNMFIDVAHLPSTERTSWVATTPKLAGVSHS